MDSSAAFRFEVPKRVYRDCCRNFKSAALGAVGGSTPPGLTKSKQKSVSRSSAEERRSSKAGVARSNRAGTTNMLYGRWCAAARNRPRKPGRPLGRGFDSFTFRQFTQHVRRCCARVGWALASPRRCKRPASAVVVQFHPYPPIPRTWLNGRVPERHSGGVGSTPAVRTIRQPTGR